MDFPRGIRGVSVVFGTLLNGALIGHWVAGSPDYKSAKRDSPMLVGKCR